MIGRLACNAAGVWTYRQPGLGDRRHPVQKVRKALKNLRSAIEECRRAAGPHDSQYLNASTLFSSHMLNSQKSGKNLRFIDEAIDWALNAGNALKANRPSEIRFKYFLYELENICRSVDLPTDDDSFIELVYRCQRVLPSSMLPSSMGELTKQSTKRIVLDYRKRPFGK